jgi:FdhE protein
MSPASAPDLQQIFEETIPAIAPVPAAIFEKRSTRLQFLAPGHMLGEYLEAMARLAKAQQAALRIYASRDTERPMQPPLLSACHAGVEGILRETLDVIISEMQPAPLPEESRAALSRLISAAPGDLMSTAKAILERNYDSIDFAASPFLASALQVYWTDLASRVKPEAKERVSYTCPVCGSPPVAGVILSDRKLRYLCCSLCATHWYVPRLTCTNCGSTAGLSYFVVEGDRDGIKAEACSQCRTYLKLFYLESNPDADSFADDLATLALDVLMSDKSYCRIGVNLFLLQK